MPYEMRLFEDTLFGDEEVRFEDPAPRALYVSAGTVSVNGEELPLDEGVVSTDAATVCAGGEGATLWRWEIGASDAGARADRHRTSLRLAGRIDPAAIADELLIRLDSVAFPPGGTALPPHPPGPRNQVPPRGGDQNRYGGPLLLLWPRRRLVRKRAGARVRTSVGQRPQPFHSDDAPATIPARRVVHSLRQRRGPRQAEVADLSGVCRKTRRSRSCIDSVRNTLVRTGGRRGTPRGSPA